MVFSVEFIDRVLKADDPVGAVSVRAVNGIWRTLAAGPFARSSSAEASGLSPVNGLLFGGGIKQLGVQALGPLSALAWAVAAAVLLFLAMKRTIGIRVTDKEQLDGLGLAERNIEAYPEFLISAEGGVAVEKVEAIIRPERLDGVLAGLRGLRYPGITITEVKGHGKQGGVTHMRRGEEHDVEFLPKIELEVVVLDEDLARAVSAVVKAGRAGAIGDGKIFSTTSMMPSASAPARAGSMPSDPAHHSARCS